MKKQFYAERRARLERERSSVLACRRPDAWSVTEEIANRLLLSSATFSHSRV